MDGGGDWVLLKNGIEGGSVAQIDLIKRRLLPGDGFDAFQNGDFAVG